MDIGAVRRLNLHEYQSKDLMEKFGVQVQKGKMASSAKEAGQIAKWIRAGNPNAELILKAQIHAGGRGKGTFDNGFKGGVKVCSTVEQVEEYASKMLGSKLVTKQTGPSGQLCSKVLVNEGITIERELYFAILMDRASNGPVLVASTQGGMDIEEVAEKSPHAIVKVPVDIKLGLQDNDARMLAQKLGFTGELVDKSVKQFKSLYTLFMATDATQVEINPLAVGSIPGGAKDLVFAVDAKLNFDDNASFRQTDIYSLRDKSMEDARDVAAEEAGLNYIGLDGNIGCLVNGAGLAMATMDIIKLHGGSPANFLDVGGGATADQVTKAFKILTSDPNVKAILVNIFGGIMKCDTIATGIIQAAKEVQLNIPLVVRLEGTNVEKGKDLLKGSGIKVTTALDLDDAAKKAVAVLA
jgi:succinyl-CoA synthetase beta subunit